MLADLRNGLLAAFAFTTCLSGVSLAEVQLPNIFGDHMVLQRQQANRVWGKADPGEAVTVSIAGQEHQTKADDRGAWSVELDSMDAGGPHTLAVKGSNEISIADVLVGEVWICSGQSNMEWSMQNSYDFDLEKLAANNPNLRMINYPNVGVQEPIFSHKNSKWMVCSPDTLGNFSAVGYFFGKDLQATLDIPIGLVHDAWGGSACEAWINRAAIKEAGHDGLLKRWEAMELELEQLSAIEEPTKKQQDRLDNLKRTMGGNSRPANIYNGVLKSHLGYGIRGAIWYQGESNAGRAYQYRELFPLMISSWRKEWGQGDFPFYWVQLADFQGETDQPGDSDWAELREAQTMTLDALPNVGQAVIIDVGEGRDIHPRNKRDVGNRLARLALANEYGYDIASQSPRYKSMEKQDGKIVLSFDHVDGGLRAFDVNQPVGFSVAGEDKKFVWAEAKIIDGDRIEVWSPEVAAPAAVRYGWAANPEVNVYDGAHLPLTPFRTDDWQGVTAGRE
ncbi:hypothetical protein Pla123a_40720 [Posidoniimonas polymericola]|uniref:Sialate O-acetylesterase domain-containing protein n=1 Tax=Posidoniimonas polymericola TaxID=2528002 RepID=A0A5C5YDB0_9BACT|nr:sialate O-acetylesterase [Posidoniimonas polymericola]TWT72773.1 hypothetical protein Pla123a_40720 [Posidoniimonas polymericola]